jgi:hypothetical protein
MLGVGVELADRLALRGGVGGVVAQPPRLRRHSSTNQANFSRIYSPLLWQQLSHLFK